MAMNLIFELTVGRRQAKASLVPNFHFSRRWAKKELIGDWCVSTHPATCKLNLNFMVLGQELVLMSYREWENIVVVEAFNDQNAF
jgi:hypothetical protein